MDLLRKTGIFGSLRLWVFCIRMRWVWRSVGDGRERDGGVLLLSWGGCAFLSWESEGGERERERGMWYGVFCFVFV